ncbi:P-loop containing nucleoside triphosphate hydrolase protein [Astrocystis sublimbata]|nr:P-loop containing nucleoside triphosphate hydrolase protein [Astrocystis sublimbata]
MADPPVLSLQSKDRRLLMDIIDKLRSTGISQHVDLPQIVVCGDQSSGKSSVLQAISGMSFPVKDGLGTRFATELILRHTPEQTTEACRVSIQPGNDRSPEDCERSRNFTFSETPDQNNIGLIIEEAKSVMGLADQLNEGAATGNQSKSLSSDILRIELSGPAQPHLTIVDLPGLFRASNKEQSAESARMVRSQVYDYIKGPRSIILAVVSAKSESVLQDVTELTREVDPHGQRTMGLITKPDTLDIGSEEERKYFEMAQNNNIVFRLGWHVVRNRDFKSRDSTNEERDQAERQFLAQGIWSALPHKVKGAAALQERLSEVLTSHILDQLQHLLRDIEQEIDHCSTRLQRMGDPRATVNHQRKYLVTASHRFSNLIQEAVDGIYRDKFFGDAHVDKDYSKRLRAVVQNELTDCADTMRRKGEERLIVETGSGSALRDHVMRADYLKEVRALMRRTRGRELPGTYNPLIIGDLFRQQCRPWRGILEKYAQNILDAAHVSVKEALSEVVDDDSMTTLWARLILPALEVLEQSLHMKMSEILKPHESGHPITSNHYFTENFQKIQARRQRAQFETSLSQFHLDSGGRILATPEAILNALTQQTEADMELLACSNVTDMMQAYYKVALKDVVHDFDTLAIEDSLVSQLPTLWTPDKVLDLPDDVINRIAGESESKVVERSEIREKLAILLSGQRDLKRLGEKHHTVFNHANTKEETTVVVEVFDDETSHHSDDEEQEPDEPSEHSDNEEPSSDGTTSQSDSEEQGPEEAPRRSENKQQKSDEDLNFGVFRGFGSRKDPVPFGAPPSSVFTFNKPLESPRAELRASPAQKNQRRKK